MVRKPDAVRAFDRETIRVLERASTRVLLRPSVYLTTSGGEFRLQPGKLRRARIVRQPTPLPKLQPYRFRSLLFRPGGLARPRRRSRPGQAELAQVRPAKSFPTSHPGLQ